MLRMRKEWTEMIGTIKKIYLFYLILRGKEEPTG